MQRVIVALPDQRIRQKSAPVTSFDKSLEKLIQDLIDTATVQTDPIALGMAAPQIGVTKRVFIARIRNKFVVFINPRILKTSKEETSLLEGCFSVSGLYGQVNRPAELNLEAYDKQGRKIRKTFRGLPAKIIQHEIDHLNGILFIDHIKNQNGKLFKVEKTKTGKEELVEIALA